MELSAEERRRIYEEEKARVEANASQEPQLSSVRPNARRQSNKGIRLASLIACLAVVLAFLGWFGFRQYRLSQLKGKLQESIGRDIGSTETILRVETDSRKMTYAELFDLCDKSVQARTDLIIELRGLYPDIDYKFKKQLIDYLNAENEFVRGKRDFYRKMLNESSAQDALLEGLRDFPSNSYGWEYYEQRKIRLRDELRKAADELSVTSDAYWDSYQQVAKQEIGIDQTARGIGIRFQPIFGKFAQANQNAAASARSASRVAIAGLTSIK